MSSSIDFSIRKVTREEFMRNGYSEKPFFKGADGFATAFYTKSDMQDMWEHCRGIVGEDGVVRSAIITTISKRGIPVANLQLIHTFSEFRGKGYARMLTEDSLVNSHLAGAQYFRVSAEPEAVKFYEKLGFTFLGKQKSGCQLSMFKFPKDLEGKTILPKDMIYDISDHVIKAAVWGTRKGCVRELFEPFKSYVEARPDEFKPIIPVEPRETVTVTFRPDLGIPPKEIDLKTGELLHSDFSNAVQHAGLPRMIDLGFRSGPAGIEEYNKIREISREVAEEILRKFLTQFLHSLGSPATQVPVAASPPPPPPAPLPVATPLAPAPPPQPVVKPAKVKLPKPPRITFMDPEREARIKDFVAETHALSILQDTPKAINIRGTNGSGKSWLMLEILQDPKWTVEKVMEGNKIRRYILRQPGKIPLCILGSYETACGGCDGISGHDSLTKIYDMVERTVTQDKMHILFEGIIVCSDFKRTRDLVERKFPLTIFMLNTPLEDCIRNVNSRRALKGNGPLPNPGNIIAKYEGNKSSVQRFRDAGVLVVEMSSLETLSALRGTVA